MTRNQKLELLRIGDDAGPLHSPGSPRGAVSTGTRDERVLLALGLVEKVPDSGSAIFARARSFVRLTDSGLAAYTHLLTDISLRRLKRAGTLVASANDNE